MKYWGIISRHFHSQGFPCRTTLWAQLYAICVFLLNFHVRYFLPCSQTIAGTVGHSSLKTDPSGGLSEAVFSATLGHPRPTLSPPHAGGSVSQAEVACLCSVVLSFSIFTKSSDFLKILLWVSNKACL